MSVNTKLCDFSRKYLPLVKQQHDTMSEGDFIQWMESSFKNVDSKLLNDLEEALSMRVSSSESDIVPSLVPSIARVIISSATVNPSIDSLYIGRSDLRLQMEQRFAEDIAALTIFDRHAKGPAMWIDFNDKGNFGLNKGNENIRLYKCSLIDAMYDEMRDAGFIDELPVYPNPEDSALEYDGKIQNALRTYRSFLISNENAGKAYTEFAILQNFDELIKAKMPFIEFNEKLVYDFADKYTYRGPSVEHYKGFTSSESAAIENQESDLAKILLSVIPEIDGEGKEIPGSFIGLSGFNSAMSSLKKAILYSPEIFTDQSRETYFDGLNIDLNSLIDQYIAKLSDPRNKIDDNHRTFLISKLRGIQKFVYGEDINPIIKNMFTQMFFKTESISYRAYAFDSDSNTFKGKNLASTIVNTQRYQLEDAIRGAVYLLTSNTDLAEKLRDKYNVVIDEEHATIFLSNMRNQIAITFGRVKGNPEIKFAVEQNQTSYTQAFLESAVSDFLSILIPDTYMRIGQQLSGNTFTLMQDFKMPLGLVLLATYAPKLTRDIYKSPGIVNLIPYIQTLTEPAKKFSVIYGSETKNVVKSPSGNNLPTYQLTNMSYNSLSMIHDALNYTQEGINPYENNYLVRIKGLLTAPQVRNEIKMGLTTKEASKLTIKELLHVSVLYDFYESLNEGDIIYLQNATFADKSTHYLVGYDTSVKINRKSLRERIDEILNGKASDSITDLAFESRGNRIRAIVSNILETYRKVCQLQTNGVAILNPNKFRCAVDFNFETLEGLDTFLKYGQINVAKPGEIANWKKLTIESLTQAFADAGYVFKEEFYASKPKNESLGQIRVNETLMNYSRIFKDKGLWEARITKARRSFIANIEDNKWKWNRYDSGTMRKIWDKYRTILGSEWFDENSGDMRLHVGEKLHPILEAYFAADLFLSNEYNDLTIGEVFAHPNKNKKLTNISGIHDIYSKLGPRTQSGHIAIATWASLKDATSPFDTNGNIISTRIKGSSDESFGNTFTPDVRLIRPGMQWVPTVKDAVESYIKAVLTSDDPHYQWIREQCRSGRLKGKTIFYYSELNEPSHATALDYLINDFDWNSFDPDEFLQEEGTYEEFSEANRLIAQIKRSVAFGATYHPFAQNQLNGVTSIIDIAVIDDMKGLVFTPNGQEDEVDSMDGSGISDALEARFESNSLLDARVGDNKKTIMMDVDRQLGAPVLLKWAVYALTSRVRRESFKSAASGELLCRKMRSKEIRLVENIAEYYNQRDSKIVYEDYLSGERRRIDKVALETIDNAGTQAYVQYYTVLDQNGDEVLNSANSKIISFDARTLYALDQLFGGAWTCKLNDNGTWSYTEENNDMLEYILSKKENQDLKRGFIAYAVNKSAIKVGAGNVNLASSFSDDSPLMTMQMRTKYGGVQMDADQDLDEEEVTEMTQMISSLIEDGHYSDLVYQIYSDLGQVVAKHMKRYMDLVDLVDTRGLSPNEKREAKEKLYQILGESLIAAFNTGNKDTLGLAQAFVQKASEAIRNNERFKIPFSAATITGAFISDVIASINKGGIRHKYEGLSGVLNPSHNMIQYYRIFNSDTGKFEIRLFAQLAEKIREDKSLNVDKVCDEHGINVIKNTDGTFSTQLTNPFVIKTTKNTIDFEDTIILFDKSTGVLYQPRYINSYEEYDDIKYLLDKSSNLTAYLWTTKGRNLRGADTRFTINGVEYSYYDLDSVRASFYINRLIKNYGKKSAGGVLKNYQLDFLRTTIGYSDIDTVDLATLLSYLKAQQTRTQNILKAIETQRQFRFKGEDVIATSWRTRAPEIIMGRYQGEKFGLSKNDHIYQIQDYTYFESKLRARYDEIEGARLDKDLYDVILYDGDEKYYVKIGNDDQLYHLFTQYGGFRDNSEFVVNGTHIWHDNEELTTTTGKRFKTFTDQNGNQFNIILVNTVGDYRSLLRSGMFDKQIQTYNYTENNKNDLNQIRFRDTTNGYRLKFEYDGVVRTKRYFNPHAGDLQEDADVRREIAIENKAKDMYDSFKQSLYYVGARIPTQAMQSFMPMEVVAFTESDINLVYVPKMQTYLEGSDYDIDKLYIMAFSVNNNGSIFTGSELQKYLPLNIVTNLVKANGITYESDPNNGINVSYNEVQELLNAVDDNGSVNSKSIIDLLNRIYTSKEETIVFENPDGLTLDQIEDYEEDKQRFIDIINTHSESNQDLKGFALKNRIVSAIYNITTKLQNQLIAQVPINMDEQHEAANNSTLGRAEMHINSDDPSTKYMMQVQNMIGKEVIGISAVALKGFFALTFVYSRYLTEFNNNLQDGDSEECLESLRKLLIVNPLLPKTADAVTSIANLDVEQTLDLIEDNSRLRTLQVRKEAIGDDVIGAFINQYIRDSVVINDTELVSIDLHELFTELNRRVNRTDAALTISGIISAATDNAKELILAKINATPDLVDIYTYLTALGIPFREIADFMTSRDIQFVTKLGKSDIFNKGTQNYSVKDTIQFCAGKDLLKGIPRDVITVYLTLNGTSGDTYLENKDLLAKLSDDELVKKAIQAINTSLKGLNINDDQLDAMMEERDYLIQAGQLSEFTRDIAIEPYKFYELRDAIKFLELVLERNKYLNSTTLRKLSDISKAVEEVSTLGQALGINQGQPTKLYKLKNMKERFRRWIDKNGDGVFDFNLDRFITDEQYREEQIRNYEDNKQTFNILEVITKLPHFWQMIKTLHYSERMIRMFSIRNSAILDLAEAIEDNVEAREKARSKQRKETRLRLSEQEFKSISDYINEIIIARFLRESGFEVLITPDAKIRMHPEDTPVHPMLTRSLRLDTDGSLDNFKLWMDTYVIPKIIENYKGNSFAESLRPLANEDSKGRKLTGWKLPLQMLDIDKSPNTIQIYGEILAGFNEIANQGAGEFGQTIGSLFYVYNMIVNKDSFGQNAFTRLFENLIQTDAGSMVNLFNEYVSSLDDKDWSFTELGATVNEAKYRINRDNPDSRIKSDLANGQFNPLLLDLPFFYTTPINSILSEEEIARRDREHPTIHYKFDLDPVAITTELVKQLQQRIPESKVFLITDDELKEKFAQTPQFRDICDSKGFILDGDIYINISKSEELSSAVFLHEFTHVILAYLKYSKPDLYYSILASVKNNPKFDEIAARYPNHIGSDLYEEVFANLLETFLANKEYITDTGESKKVTSGFMVNYTEGIVSVFNYLFDLQGYILKPEDIVGHKLDDVLSAFGHNLLDGNIPIGKAIIQDSQIQNTIKRQLYEDNKLTNSCDET